MTTVTPEIEARAQQLLRGLTPAEKFRLLAGEQGLHDFMLGAADRAAERHPQPAATVPRLGLTGLRFVDGPRGIAAGVSTCFPVPIARAAAFDYRLEERVGEAMGREARAHGANWCGAPCLNLLRHPGWGRAQETYGENSLRVGEMGAAFTRGLQRHTMACAKHFACNSIETSRFEVDVRVEPDVLESVYLPHFRRVVDEGVASVMSAYNSVNGEWCGQNRTLLTAILKERWGFDGFVVGDWIFGIRDGVQAVAAGLDLEMPAELFVDARAAKAVEGGLLPAARVDDAALRLIRQQLRFHTVGDGNYGPEVVASAEHRALAREVATRGIVLLRNEPVDETPVLPLVPGPELRRLAVVGRLADVPNTGDRGSSDVKAPYVITPLAGLREALAPLGVEVTHDDGSQHGRAAAVAASADAVIVVAGYDYRDEGEFMGGFPPAGFEGLLPRPPLRLLPRLLATLAHLRGNRAAQLEAGGDRMSLTLRSEEEDLIQAVAAANRRTVVVLVCGSAVLMERWRRAVPGIVILWYPGMEGGRALADILLGRENPTGRLPVAIPMSADHLPDFDPAAHVAEYGELHGQALLDHLGVEAAFPYGFGLSYKR